MINNDFFFLLFVWRDGYDTFSEKCMQGHMYSMFFFNFLPFLSLPWVNIHISMNLMHTSCQHCKWGTEGRLEGEKKGLRVY